jgi:intraflagellar transport protein 81
LYFREAVGCVQIIVESSGDNYIVTLILLQYGKLIEDFKLVHKESEMLKNSGYSTSELRADIDTMEREKDIVIKRIERMQQKVWNKICRCSPNIACFH